MGTETKKAYFPPSDSMEPGSGILIEPYSGTRVIFGSIVDNPSNDETNQISS